MFKRIVPRVNIVNSGNFVFTDIEDLKDMLLHERAEGHDLIKIEKSKTHDAYIYFYRGKDTRYYNVV